MAKNDHNDIEDTVAAGRDKTQGQYDELVQNRGALQPGLDQAGSSERGYLTSNLQNYAQTGGVTSDDEARIRALNSPMNRSSSSSGGGGGGDSAPPAYVGDKYADAEAGYKNLAATGGIDLANVLSGYQGFQGANGGFSDANLADIKGSQTALADNSRFDATRSSANDLTQFSTNAGISDADRANINRDYFKTLEQTGGYTDQDKNAIRSRSNSVIPGFYNNLTDNINKTRSIAGGYSPGFSAANRSIARQSAQQAGEQARDTELGIAEKVLAGRLTGAKEISGAQLALSGIETPVKLAALQSAGQLNLGTENARTSALTASGDMGLKTQNQISSDRLAGYGGEQSAKESVRSGQIAGYGGELGIAQSRAQEEIAAANRASAAAAASAAQDLAERRFQAQNEFGLLNSKQQGQQSGYGDLINLYGTAYAPGEANYNDWLNAVNSESKSDQGYTSAMINNAVNVPGNGQILANNVMQGAGMVGGVLSGFGIGDVGQRRAGQTQLPQQINGLQGSGYYGQDGYYF